VKSVEKKKEYMSERKGWVTTGKILGGALPSVSSRWTRFRKRKVNGFKKNWDQGERESAKRQDRGRARGVGSGKN